jgi:hypothetical protein
LGLTAEMVGLIRWLKEPGPFAELAIVVDVLISLFGVENHVPLLRECAPAVLIFVYGLMLLRLSGRRTLGHMYFL